MAKRYDPTEYLYASARIRSLELRLTSREQWSRLCEMHSPDEILAAYCDKGTRSENAAEEALRQAFDTVTESVPDKTLCRFLQYPYDCNNVKALIKCRLRNVDADGLLIDLGSIPVKDLQAASESELSLLLPQHMARALPQAVEAFDKTGNPREIDFILDKAVFADMREAAEPFPFAAELVAARADLTDLLICCRLLRMQNHELCRALLDRAAICCGRFDREKLLSLFDGGEDALPRGISDTPYAKIFDTGLSLSELEKRADDYIADLVRRARAVTFGVEIPIAYLMAIENESKNLRILLAGKRAGWDSATVKARMREHYV